MVKAIWSLNFLIVNVLKFHCDPRKKKSVMKGLIWYQAPKICLFVETSWALDGATGSKAPQRNLHAQGMYIFSITIFDLSFCLFMILAQNPTGYPLNIRDRFCLRLLFAFLGRYIVFFVIRQISVTFASASIYVLFKAYYWLVIILLLPTFVIWRSVMKIAVAGDVDFCMSLMAFGS